MAASRGTAELVEQIRDTLASGRFRQGHFLPPIRELSAEYGVSPETVRRGLKALESEGLLVAEPRQGFRVAAPGNGETENCPVAYVTRYGADLSNAQPANWAISRRLQEEVGRRGWSMLGAHSGNGGSGQVLEQLRAAKTWGVVLDTLDEELFAAVQRSDLPVVMVNSWVEGADCDVVLQDNYLGGFIAAQHLLDSGAKRIGWLGPVESFCHSRERWAGAVAGLVARGAAIDPGHVVRIREENMPARLRELLTREDRPDGLLVFWTRMARELVSITRELGLQIGSDIKVVGWSVEELYESEHAVTYAGGKVPPAVLWKASDMAEAALERLGARRQGGGTRRTCVPVRIRHHGKGEGE